MKRVFFLGAGFSKHAGFPLGSELLDFVRKNLSSSVDILDKERYLPILEEVVKIYVSSGRGFFASNLELLLTSFTLSSQYNDKDFIDRFKPIYEKYIGRDGIKDYFSPNHILVRIAHGIKNAFLIHHRRISNFGKSRPIADKDKVSAYNSFFDILNQGDTIVTLNYDVLCEQGLWIRDKWTPLDGYGFKKDKESLIDKKNLHLYRKREQSLIKIYKLHGSVNWAEKYSEEGIILTNLIHDFGDIFLRREDDDISVNEDKYFILPNYSRSFIEQDEILEVWRSAKEAIANCEELYFIGYSLSDVDSSLQFMLHDAVKVNSNPKKIYLINNQRINNGNLLTDSNVILRFQEFFDNGCILIKKSFEDWILEK